MQLWRSSFVGLITRFEPRVRFWEREGRRGCILNSTRFEIPAKCACAFRGGFSKLLDGIVPRLFFLPLDALQDSIKLLG